jgi:hypothetical protein
VDVAIASARLETLVAEFLARSDFEGAENLLLDSLSSEPAEVVHLQLGRLYLRWNKLTSAVNHFHHALATADEPLVREILRDLDRARALRSEQRP